MKDFEIAKTLFKDSIDTSFYFDSVSAEAARKKLTDILNAKKNSLVFVLGDPGVGKTHMLTMLHHSPLFSSHSIFMQHPCFEWQELFLKLYSLKGLPFDETENEDIHCELLGELYSDETCIVFVDEAQLLCEKQFEMIAKLCSLHSFQCVLALHKDDVKKVANHSSFKNLSQETIFYGTLNEQELHRYLQAQLMAHSQGEIALMFSARNTKKIARYAKGNFRTVKKFFYSLFKLLDYAQKNNLTKQTTLSNCLLVMTALDIGLIRDA